jgi:hypothetical protein
MGRNRCLYRRGSQSGHTHLSGEKGDQLKSICSFWLEIINQGVNELDYKHLLSDWGFMVYVAQAYPGMKPYLKGFHLSLETWQEGCDEEGWKLNAKDRERVDEECEANPNKAPSRMEDVKVNLMTRMVTGNNKATSGPTAGFTLAAPCFKEDLEAILFLAQGEWLAMRRIWNKQTVMAYYGFGDASSAGFKSTVERPDGLQGRYGLWGADEEHQSSNYQEPCNLAETVEEEAAAGYLKDGEFWLFMDNSTAESCFFKGGSSLKLLHNLVL